MAVAYCEGGWTGTETVARKESSWACPVFTTRILGVQSRDVPELQASSSLHSHLTKQDGGPGFPLWVLATWG